MEEKKFEEALRELEAIVKRLESGELPLEESLKTFEQGVALSKYCFQKLEEAEKRVSILMKDEGGLRKAPFDTGEDEYAEGD
jgi:exodeoxyribonuclease VII small subunit